MHYLYLIAVAFGSFYERWFCFLAVMNLKRAKDLGLLNKTARALGTPILLVGYVLDLFVNVLVMTPLLMELPEELTVTARLKRHIRYSTGWRQRLALWFVPLLDPFDGTGHHVTEPNP